MSIFGQTRSLRRTPMLLLCAAIMMVDGYDLMAMPLAVPYVSSDLGIAASDLGFVLSAVLLGLGIGALLLGPLGDRFGRRPVILLSLLGLAVATAGTATSNVIPEFLTWRFATGVCLGACLTNVTALVSEVAIPSQRAATLTLVSSGVSVGAIAAGLVAPALAHDAFWEPIFLIPGGFTIVLAGFASIFLSESPNFQAAKKTGLQTSSLVHAAPETADTARWPLFFAPLAQLYRARTAIFALLYATSVCVVYMVTSWLPTILPQAGFTLRQAAHFTSLQSAGGLIAGILLSLLLDRRDPGSVLFWTYLMIALGFASFSIIPPIAIAWGLLILVAVGGMSGVQLSLMAVGTGLYPPAILSSAIGLTVAVGRIGAIGGPLLGSALLKQHATPSQFFLGAVIPLGLCAAGSLALSRAQRRGPATGESYQ